MSEDEMDEATRKVEHAKSTDHERIWLSPSCESPERTWCPDAVLEVCEECGARPVEYIRADLVAPVVAEASADPAADLAGLPGATYKLTRALLALDLPAGHPVFVALSEHTEEVERLLRERGEERRIFHDTQWRQLKKCQAERDAALRERDDLMRRLKGIEDV